MRNEKILLYEGKSDVYLEMYLLPDQIDYRPIAPRPAVVICPGGGYSSHLESEAEPVALHFLAKGYQVFVVYYGIGSGAALFPGPFLDVAKAIALVRKNQVQWHVDPSKVYLCGLSTGGHVAAVVACLWQEALFSEALGEESGRFRPDALILGYPLLDLATFEMRLKQAGDHGQIHAQMLFEATLGTGAPSVAQLGQWCCKNLVSKEMMPTFIWGVTNDVLFSDSDCTDFAKALSEQEIPNKLLIFERDKRDVNWVSPVLSWLSNI